MWDKDFWQGDTSWSRKKWNPDEIRFPEKRRETVRGKKKKLQMGKVLCKSNSVQSTKYIEKKDLNTSTIPLGKNVLKYVLEVHVLCTCTCTLYLKYKYCPCLDQSHPTPHSSFLGAGYNKVCGLYYSTTSQYTKSAGYIRVRVIFENLRIIIYSCLLWIWSLETFSQPT